MDRQEEKIKILKKQEEEYSEKTPLARKPVKGSAYEKDPVGLAVEIFSKLVIGDMPRDDEVPREYATRLMNISIDLVKQAQKAFS